MISAIDYKLFINALKNSHQNLELNKQRVNDLNVFPVPDGDTGTNMALTIQYAVKECVNANAKTVGDAIAAASSGALMGARGNSGVILSQLFRGMSKSLKGKAEIGVKDIAEAMIAASEMAYKAVMKPTEGTILTVSREMAEFARDNCEQYDDIALFLKDIIKTGYVSLENTPNLLAVLKEAGVVDSGAQGLLYILEGALMAIEGKILDSVSAELASAARERIPDIQTEIEYAYCTEFLISVKDGQNYEKYLIDKLIKLGDSLLVIQDNNIVKIHVHTNEPWTAMKIAAGTGDLAKIKIDNMREQHKELFESELHQANEEKKDAVKYSSEKVPYVLIAVSAGEGFNSILKDMGITYIIEGGQTMNPSTQDFLEIIDNTNADNYILIPNNKNIILAANQAKNISGKNVAVLETRAVPESISALLAFNPYEELNENIENMKQIITTVKTANVTYAVRDGKFGKNHIEEGDVIGIIGSDIAVDEKDVASAALKTVEKLINDSTELVTLYYGSDVSKQDAQALQIRIQHALKEASHEADVELFYGGQPLYYYIISAE